MKMAIKWDVQYDMGSKPDSGLVSPTYEVLFEFVRGEGWKGVYQHADSLKL